MIAGPQHREIGFPISTDNASWRGPNTENFKKKFYKQCKLGWGPNTEADEKSAYDNVEVGVGRRNKFCENIISVPLPQVNDESISLVIK
ncbi:hypothetical protein C7P91_08670 [Staphylococcus aureus]|nr:hypothetical protein C7Q20_05960 [Staphylococcus aureus]PZL52354.1 hypothetical protein C7P91_08670 [Staphylococcus aureus]